MSTANNNLSIVKGSNVTPTSSNEDYIIGIIWSEWNTEITSALKDGAVNTLIQNGVLAKNIIIKTVPGAFELTLGAQWLAENTEAEAVICLGCVIQGETKHFDFICNAVAQGITNLNIEFSLPFVFGVLTTDNLQQAIDRAGGKHGNKGDEAAITALKMLALEEDLINEA
jgi:6,7-dimethyl-8-ribityllumazine synthase